MNNPVKILCCLLWGMMPNLLTAQPLSDVLLSTRIEVIDYRSHHGLIRESEDDTRRLYLSNVYFNAEGPLSDQLDFIIEAQALTSELYLLGGFVTIADSLEGIAGDEALTSRQEQVSNLARQHIEDISDSEDTLNFERAHLDYQPLSYLGIKVGSVRIPFGFWDDYSLFRNLSAGKTDPISLGVQLRRADVGAMIYGHLWQRKFNWELGLVNGEETSEVDDSDTGKDATIRLGSSWQSLDFGFNAYIRGINELNDIFAMGLYYRHRTSESLTLLGEIAVMENTQQNISTEFLYIQGNYNLGNWVQGLRWNFFLESYTSDLLKADLEPDPDYRYAGTHIQLSTGLLYAFDRNFELGAQYISGFDEEGDSIARSALKLDIQF